MSAHFHSRGVSLVSVAISLAVLGIIAIAISAYWAQVQDEIRRDVDRSLMVRSERALLSYLYVNQRLPCPDLVDDGLDGDEDLAASGAGGCRGGAQKGRLPWRTLGVADARASELLYGVYAAATTELTTDVDRYKPLETLPGGVASETLLGNANLLDFCYGLQAAGYNPDPSGLQMVDDGGSRAIAYALASPGAGDADGDGSHFDGRQSSDDAVFDSPRQAATAVNDDRIAVAGFYAVFSKLSCGEALAAVGHTHFNAANMARFLDIAFSDYKGVLEVEQLLSAAGVAAATAAILSSSAGIADGVAATALGVAQAIGTYGALSPVIATGVVVTISETAGLVISAASLGTAIAAEISVQARLDEIGGFIDRADNLAGDVGDNAGTADREGLQP